MKYGLPLVALLGIISGCGKPVEKTELSVEVAALAKAESKAQAVTISVAAASDLKYAFDDVIVEFQKTHPEIEVEATYGASGHFFAQLSNKAPFDLFLSADMSYPRKLIEQNDAVKESEFQYSVGRISLWVRNDSPLNLERDGIKVLDDSHVKKISIANPKHAPYGRAAEAALKHFGIYDSVREQLVLGENVAQATQFVETGAADVGIIAHSLALAPPLKEKGRHWILPIESHPKLDQGGVILVWAKNRDACNRLREFLISEAGRAVLRRHGFERPLE